MSQIKQFSLLLVCVCLAVLFTSGLQTNLIKAQNTNETSNTIEKSMESLVNRLIEKMNNEPGKILYFSFVKPLVGDTTDLAIGDPKDKYETRIVEVGKDYLCFREIAGSADGRRCTPFSNIVSVFYLNN